MRTNAVYKKAFNQCLRLIEDVEIGGELGTENQLADQLGVSRTTIRLVIDGLTTGGIIKVDGRRKEIVRYPNSDEYFPEIETKSVRSIIQKKFMEMVLHRDINPGDQINSFELARHFSVSPSALREYLNDFSQCGLLERRPNSSWIFRGFDPAFARELSCVRELFELEAASKFADLPDDHPAWERLDALEKRHILFLANVEERNAEFSDLDDALHELINSAAENRFIDNFHALRCLVFHYHYQWTKDDEKQRNFIAVQEHLSYIAALRSRDHDAIRATGRAHLRTALQGLLTSLERRGPAPDPSAGGEGRRAFSMYEIK